MATEEIAVKITADAGQANQSVGSFKAQLREATAELVNMSMKFGEGSAEAQKAAQKVANLKDAIGDAKALADTFNPDKKFVALGGAIQGAVGGFSALQGAMGLFGSESKDVEKLLLKVQSAMALQQGISGVFGAIDSFKLLKNELVGGVSKAFGTLRGAIISTGIGALVVGLGLLITNFEKVKQVVLNFIPGLAKVGDFVTGLVNKITDFIGVTSEAARAQEKFIAASEKSLKAAKDFLDQEGFKYDEYTKKKIQADIDYKENVLKVNKDEALSQEEKNKALKNYLEKRNFEIDQADKERDKKAQDAIDETNKKQKEKEAAAAKERADKKKAEAEKLRQQQKTDNEAAAKQLRELEQENFLNSIEDENKRAQEKARIDFENAEKEIEKTTADAEKKNAIKKELRIKYEEELRDLELQLLMEQNERDAQASEEEKKKAEERDKAELERIKKFNELKKQQDEEFKKAQVEAEVNLQKARYNAIDAGFELINALAGKNETVANILFAVQKGLEIGKIIVGAAASIAQIKFNMASVPPFLGPAPNPAYFVNLAAGLKNIASVKIGAAAGIASIVASSISKFKGGGGAGVQAGGGTPGSPGGGAAQTAPIQPQAQTTRIDQAQINQIGNAAVRSYVLETDVANNQERRIRIERAARIG